MTKLQVEACPDLALRLRSPLQEAGAHAALLDCAQSFSPKVEDSADDTLLLDLAGLERKLERAGTTLPCTDNRSGFLHRSWKIGRVAHR